MSHSKELINEGVRRGIISGEQALKILAIDEESSQPSVEKKRGFNSIMAFYYFGAMIIIFAFTYFLTLQWKTLPTEIILLVAVTFQSICFGMGIYLRKKLNYNISGGLLVSVAVAITPLTIYCLEKIFGIWPVEVSVRGYAYNNYSTLIKPCWVYIELATLMVAAIVLYWVRFSFIVLIIGHTLWFLSMDLVELLLGPSHYGEAYWETRKWVSILISAAMIGTAKILNRRTKEDYSLWLFLYGGLIFTTSTAFTWLDNEVEALLYCAVHIAMVAASIAWQRKSLLVFGSIGIYVYLSYLAYRIFRDSPFFPIVLALIGLLMILGAVAFQRNKDKVFKSFK